MVGIPAARIGAISQFFCEQPEHHDHRHRRHNRPQHLEEGAEVVGVIRGHGLHHDHRVVGDLLVFVDVRKPVDHDVQAVQADHQNKEHVQVATQQVAVKRRGHEAAAGKGENSGRRREPEIISLSSVRKKNRDGLQANSQAGSRPAWKMENLAKMPLFRLRNASADVMPFEEKTPA